MNRLAVTLCGLLFVTSALVGADARTVTGTLSVANKGPAVYKFPGATVLLLPKDVGDNLAKAVIAKLGGTYAELPIYMVWQEFTAGLMQHKKGLARTDGQGRYSMAIPSGGLPSYYYIFANATRPLGNGREYKTWLVRVRAEGPTDLNEQNTWSPPR